MLRFNSDACFNALRGEMLLAMEKVITELYMEMAGSMRSQKAKDDVIKEKTIIQANLITGKIISGAHAIMDSYGTGSLMDMSNPFLDDYLATANWAIPMYNPIRLQRNTTAILGRSRGKYKPIIGGKSRTSTGLLAGLDLEEGFRVTGNKVVRIRPIPPSKAIDTSYRWMTKTRINKVVMDTVRNFDFSRFFEIVFKK